jgi:hypothetical protein
MSRVKPSACQVCLILAVALIHPARVHANSVSFPPPSAGVRVPSPLSFCETRLDACFPQFGGFLPHNPPLPLFNRIPKSLLTTLGLVVLDIMVRSGLNTCVQDPLQSVGQITLKQERSAMLRCLFWFVLMLLCGFGAAKSHKATVALTQKVYVQRYHHMVFLHVNPGDVIENNVLDLCKKVGNIRFVAAIAWPGQAFKVK